MVRKSRKHLSDPGKNTPIHAASIVAGAYLRISEVKDNRPPESIENQLKIIQEYIDKNADIELKAKYFDIRVSGRNFQRISFQQMIGDIEAGKINCVIVKDLSRLGRNLIETGYYIEKYFPLHRVRLISVTDHVETIDGVTNLDKRNPGRIPLINLLNETVSDGISQSTQSVINTYAADGKFVAPRAPYGYRKAPDDCHKLIIDPEAAQVVKDIFDMALKRISLTEIIRRLNQAGVLPPSLYARQHGLQGNYQDADNCWNTRTVKKLLTNYTYTGNLVQGKQQISARHTHEPIISEEIFEQVQGLLSASSSTQLRKNSNDDNPLRGKVICSQCSGKMQRKRGSGQAGWYFFTCITKNRRGAEFCAGENIRESDIIAAIRQELLSQKPQLTEDWDDCNNRIREIENQIASLELERTSQMSKRRDAFELCAMGTITTQEYQDAVGAYPLPTTEIEELEETMDCLKKELSVIESKISVVDNHAGIRCIANSIKQVVISNGKVQRVEFY